MMEKRKRKSFQRWQSGDLTVASTGEQSGRKVAKIWSGDLLEIECILNQLDLRHDQDALAWFRVLSPINLVQINTESSLCLVLAQLAHNSVIQIHQ